MGGLSYEAAANEVVADACETMLVNSEAVQQLAREHMSTARKIWEHIKSVFRKMQQRTEPRSQEAKLLKDQFDAMSGLWDAALEKAVEQGRSAKAAKAKSASVSEADTGKGVQFLNGKEFTLPLMKEKTDSEMEGVAEKTAITVPTEPVSKSIITEEDAESNNEFAYSLRDDTSEDTEQETAERVKSYNRLKADNEALKRQLERARREIKPTKEAKVRRADAVKAAKRNYHGLHLQAIQFRDDLKTGADKMSAPAR